MSITSNCVKNVVCLQWSDHSMTDENVKEFYEKYGFAMDMADLKFCQKYFKEEEKRDPTITDKLLLHQMAQFLLDGYVSRF